MKYIHLYLISYSDLSTVMWKFMKNKTILYSRTKNVGKDVITNHHTDREKEPAKQLFHKTLMRREGKKSDSAVKRQKFDKLAPFDILLCTKTNLTTDSMKPLAA